jgi:hypothetical protein
MIGWNSHVFSHPPIPVDTEQIQPGAAIGLSLPTGNTFSALDVGNHHHWVTCPQSIGISANLFNLTG